MASATGTAHGTAHGTDHGAAGAGHGGHHADGGGRVVAGLVAVALLVGAASLGLVTPRAHRSGVVAGGAAGPKGIVVLHGGEVLLGAVEVGGDDVVTVRGKDHTEVVPADQVRWLDPAASELTDEYWQRFGPLPLAAPWRGRGPAGRGAPGAAPGRGDVGAADAAVDRDWSEAELAMLNDRWGEAVDRWAVIYGRRGGEAALENLLKCAGNVLGDARRPEELDGGLARVEAALEPHRAHATVQYFLARAYQHVARIHIGLGNAPRVRELAERVRRLGPQFEELLGNLEAAAKHVEEAGAHDDDHGPAGDHQHGR